MSWGAEQFEVVDGDIAEVPAMAASAAGEDGTEHTVVNGVADGRSTHLEFQSTSSGSPPYRLKFT